MRTVVWNLIGEAVTGAQAASSEVLAAPSATICARGLRDIFTAWTLPYRVGRSGESEARTDWFWTRSVIRPRSVAGMVKSPVVRVT